MRIPGTIPAMNISAMDVPVMEAYTTKAILGGMTMAMELEVAISAVENGALKPPLSTIAGTRTAPRAATVAGPEPDIAPKKQATITHTIAIPPLLCPTQVSTKFYKSFGNSGFCHDISGKYKKWDCQKEKFTDSGIHISCNNGKGSSGVQDRTYGRQAQADCNGNAHDQENKK